MQRNITECSDFFHVRPQTPGAALSFFLPSPLAGNDGRLPSRSRSKHAAVQWHVPATSSMPHLSRTKGIARVSSLTGRMPSQQQHGRPAPGGVGSRLTRGRQGSKQGRQTRTRGAEPHGPLDQVSFFFSRKGQVSF
jgi:hypothetical protein